MKTLVMVLCLLMVGCSEDYKPQTKEVPMRNCIKVCRDAEFKNFHSKGDSWGSGSSSMNGLAQSSIYDRVTKECDKFYVRLKCCKRDVRDYSGKNVNHIHGYDYGECL